MYQLYSLVLEWNCIGIWEAGIQILADALSINQTLEELDLRNNKIGPQGAQSLALCLRNNTALRRLGMMPPRPVNMFQRSEITHFRSSLE